MCVCVEVDLCFFVPVGARVCVCERTRVNVYLCVRQCAYVCVCVYVCACCAGGGLRRLKNTPLKIEGQPSRPIANTNPRQPPSTLWGMVEFLVESILKLPLRRTAMGLLVELNIIPLPTPH